MVAVVTKVFYALRFAKAMSKFALKVYDTSYTDQKDEIAKIIGLPSGDDVVVRFFVSDSIFRVIGYTPV